MKITRGHLRALIKEEIISETGWESGVSAADPTVLLDFARADLSISRLVLKHLLRSTRLTSSTDLRVSDRIRVRL